VRQVVSAFDSKTKELMALAIGIAIHGDGCIAYHMKMTHQHGASRQEVVENVLLAICVAVYAGDALRAYDRFHGHAKS
jgi:AhpD family alkylhydroperoxidase